MKIGIMHGYNLEYKNARENPEFALLHKAGFDAIDLNLSDTETYFYTAEKEKLSALLDTIKSQLKLSGLFISQIHGPWCWPPERDSTPEGRKERMEKMIKSIEITAELGCKYWVIHPIMPFGCDNVPEGTEAETWRLNLEFFRELLAFAKERGVVICYENMPMPSFTISKPTTLLDFVNEINDENFKICLDTGHANLVMDGSLYDNVKLLGDNIKVLHVHDNNGNGRDEHITPTLGTIDWPLFIKALRDIGYEGVFSLETEPKFDKSSAEYEAGIRELIEKTRELLK